MMPKRKYLTSVYAENGFFPPFLCACLMVFLPMQTAVPGLALADFEQPPVFKAGSLLKPEILKGEYHSVADEVKNDGLFNHYNVKSRFGDFKASSDLALKLVVDEINAIGEMVKIETDETLAQSFKQSAENTAQGVKRLFNDPKGALEGAGTGLSNLFNRAKGTIGKRELTDAEDSRVEQLVGISKSKGEIASKYGVNVYSTNKRLQKELDRLARADFFGGLGTTVFKSAIPGAGGLLLTTSDAARLLNDTINTTPASELWLQNKNKLLAMNFNSDTVELFLNNPVFSPAQQTVLVKALETLESAANRELFLKVALQASEVEMAKVITRIAVMSAGYHQKISPLKRFAPLARITCAVAKNGSVVVLLPTDYIIWSKKVADMAEALKEKQGKPPEGAGFELWTLGTFSKRAQSKLRAMNWRLHTRVADQLKSEN